MLVRLIYASRAVTVSRESLFDIISQARDGNPSSGITGVLCHGHGIFLQALEGGRTEVNALYAKIVKDARHQDVTLLQYEEISQRRFGGWAMGQVDLGRAHTSILLRYSEKAELDPYAVNGSVSLALLEELMDNAAIIGKI
jgi:hypothetical protein